MNILVFEYISGGGLAKEPVPESLAREGSLMLRALLDDLSEIEGCRLRVLHDARFDPSSAGTAARKTAWLRVGPVDEFDAIWNSALQTVDAVWPIAPETDGVLARLCRDVQEAGKILLNSSAEAVALTSAKLATLRHLEGHGISVVPTFRLADFGGGLPGRFVVKPDDGVGCEAVRMIQSFEDLKILQETSSAKDFIVQPFLHGTAMSLSLLCRHGDARLLSCNRQKIEIRDAAFFLEGCAVNVETEDRAMFAGLARAIARALPGLFGYVGVDLMLVDGRPIVLEINPRLTTSYAVLSKALKRNVAAMVLDLLHPESGFSDSGRSAGRCLEIVLGDRLES